MLNQLPRLLLEIHRMLNQLPRLLFEIHRMLNQLPRLLFEIHRMLDQLPRLFALPSDAPPTSADPLLKPEDQRRKWAPEPTR